MIDEKTYQIKIIFEFLTHTFTNNPAESIALLALILTIWQGWLSRKHNILSVRPSIILTTNTEKIDKEKRRITVTIRNSGLGPAEILDYAFGKYNGEIISGQMTPDAWGHLLAKLCNLKNVKLESTQLAKSRFISPGEEINLLSATHEKPQDREFDIHQETCLAIKYKSLYGEKFYGGYGAIKPRLIIIFLKLLRFKIKVLG